MRLPAKGIKCAPRSQFTCRTWEYDHGSSVALVPSGWTQRTNPQAGWFLRNLPSEFSIWLSGWKCVCESRKFVALRFCLKATNVLSQKVSTVDFCQTEKFNKFLTKTEFYVY